MNRIYIALSLQITPDNELSAKAKDPNYPTQNKHETRRGVLQYAPTNFLLSFLTSIL